jgi:hypothetical protein
MQTISKQTLLIVLLAFILTGLAGCGAAQSDNGAQETSIPPLVSATIEPTEVFTCAGNNLHPIGQNIATTYEVSYQQVMTWFCSGYSFENILIALETSEAVDIPADTLLGMLIEKEWEEIWVEIGFVASQ